VLTIYKIKTRNLNLKLGDDSIQLFKLVHISISQNNANVFKGIGRC